MVGHGRAWWGKAGMVGDSPSRVVVVGRRMGLGIIIPQAWGALPRWEALGLGGLPGLAMAFLWGSSFLVATF